MSRFTFQFFYSDPPLLHDAFGWSSHNYYSKFEWWNINASMSLIPDFFSLLSNTTSTQLYGHCSVISGANL